MNITTTKQRLGNLLKIVKPSFGISTQGTSAVRFESEGADLRIEHYNAFYYRETIPDCVEGQGSFSVSGKELAEIVAVCGSEIRLEAVVESDAIKAVRILSGSLRAQLQCFYSEPPTYPEFRDGALRIDASTFGDSVRNALRFVADGDSRYILVACRFQLGADSFSVSATNGHALYASGLLEAETEDDWEEAVVLVPTDGIEAALALGGDNVSIRASDHYIEFSSGDRRGCSQLIEGTFPEIERVLGDPRHGPIETVLEPSSSLAFSRVYSAMGKPTRTKAVKLEGLGKRLRIGGRVDIRTAEETIDCVSGHAEFEIGVNPSYFADVLGCSRDDVVVKFKDENSPIYFRSAEPSFEAVVMPIRL